METISRLFSYKIYKYLQSHMPVGQHIFLWSNLVNTTCVSDRRQVMTVLMPCNQRNIYLVYYMRGICISHLKTIYLLSKLNNIIPFHFVEPYRFNTFNHLTNQSSSTSSKSANSIEKICYKNSYNLTMYTMTWWQHCKCIQHLNLPSIIEVCMSVFSGNEYA